MILDAETSSSDTKIKDSDRNTKHSKTKILYLGVMCFATNCLSSIALEAGSRGSFRSTSPIRSAVFNNLFRRAYNLRIKIMICDVLTALVSTIMLTIGDIYGIPYLYLPWLVNTIKGMAFYEGPALFGLAYVVLPNASVPAGFFIFITLLLYVEELCIWKDVLVNFERCWSSYNRSKKLKAKRSTGELAIEESCGKNAESTPDVLASRKSKDRQEPADTRKEFTNRPHNRSTTKSMGPSSELIDNRRAKATDSWNEPDIRRATTKPAHSWNEFDNYRSTTELSRTNRDKLDEKSDRDATNLAARSVEENLTTKDHRSGSPFTEVTG